MGTEGREILVGAKVGHRGQGDICEGRSWALEADDEQGMQEDGDRGRRWTENAGEGR